MEKKKYQKPSVTVYDLKQPTRLLVGSYDLGHIPATPGVGGGIGDDENKLA
jgi:hypothetical protein